jgi:hypothetical protein
MAGTCIRGVSGIVSDVKSDRRKAKRRNRNAIRNPRSAYNFFYMVLFRCCFSCGCGLDC